MTDNPFPDLPDLPVLEGLLRFSDALSSGLPSPSYAGSGLYGGRWRMTSGVKVRIMAFLVLSAVGIVYIAGSYLGIVDRVLGRGYTIHATLPTSGGLFEGSEVTYRGVKVGEVKPCTSRATACSLDLAIEDGRRAAPGLRRCSCTTCQRWGSSTSTSSRPPTRGRTPRQATR